jgi:hypothetical protein
VTFELSTPVKIVALAGLILVLAVGGIGSYTMLAKHKATPDVVSIPTHPAAGRARPGHDPAVVQFRQAHPQAAKARAAARPVVVVDRNLPAPLHQALRKSREVVAVLMAPGVPGDADAVREARAGAAAAHVGFAVLNVKQEAVAATLAAWAPTAGDGSVLVVERPGTIAVQLDGYADRQMVAQAALEPR